MVGLALASVIFSQGITLDSFNSKEDLLTYLQGAGYAVRAGSDSPRFGKIPEITFRGESVQLSTYQNGEGSKVTGVILNIIYAFPFEVRAEQLQDFEMLPDRNISFQTSLDGMVRLDASIHFGSGLTDQRFLAELKTLFAEFSWFDTQFAKPNGGLRWTSQRPLPAVPIDDNQVLRSLNEDDAFALIAAWGWNHNAGGGGSSPTWMIFSNVTSRPIVWQGLRQPDEGVRLRTYIAFRGEQPVAAWIASRQAGLAPGYRIDALPDPQGSKTAELSFDISVKNGLRIADLKKAVLRFADVANTLGR